MRFIVNTTIDVDHIGGNEALAKVGKTLAGGNTRPATVAGTGGAPIFAHENMLNRLSGSGASPTSLPTDSYFVKQKDMFVNGEAVQLLHVPAAHTDGDTIVFFRRSDVISAGDVFTPDRYPLIDLARGGSINGVLAGINYILELAVPDFNEEGGTMIVPGHGRLCDESDVSDYRDMVTIVRDRVARHGQEEDDARAGQGGEADPRLRRGVCEAGVHGRHVRRSGVSKPDVARRARGLDDRGVGTTGNRDAPDMRWGRVAAAFGRRRESAASARSEVRHSGAGGAGRGGPPPTPRAAAAFDLTGTWVAVVTEDWRWRMVTPPKNDVASVPLNAEGRKVAAAWDLGTGQRVGQSVPRLRRRGDHAAAAPRADRLAGRSHAEARDGCRTADTAVPVCAGRPGAARRQRDDARRANLAGRRPRRSG